MPLFVRRTSFEGKPKWQVRTANYLQQVHRRLKIIPGAFWKPKFGWLLPIQPDSWTALVDLFGQSEVISLPLDHTGSISDSDSQAESALSSLVETLMRKNYSYKTIKVYASYFRAFLKGINGKNLPTVSKDDIRAYLQRAASEKKWSPATQNQAVNAIRFYFVHVLGQDRNFHDLRLPRYLTPPEILSEEEVQQLLQSAPKLKHRAILTLIYTAGLRLSESVNIRLDDLQWDQKCVFIKGGRARCDRFVTLPASTWSLLHHYLRQEKPQHWLFEGPHEGPFSVRSVQQIMTQAVSLSRVNPHATIQMLRNSVAYHLLVRGNSLPAVKAALGSFHVPAIPLYPG